MAYCSFRNLAIPSWKQFCDHLGQHHRGGLERFDLFLRIGALRPILHHQHAERVAGTQDRDAQEGVVDFFAGLRPVRVGRVRRGVGQVDGVGFLATRPTRPSSDRITVWWTTSRLRPSVA